MAQRQDHSLPLSAQVDQDRPKARTHAGLREQALMAPSAHMRVSVIIPAHDGSGDLCLCLGALARSSRSPDGIMVVDDWSTDGSGEAVTIRDAGTPVFWTCDVTPQVVARQARPELMLTHAPGHTFVTDLLMDRYEQCRQAQLGDWMLYLVEREAVRSTVELTARARQAFDFSDNPALRELGLDRQAEAGPLAERSLAALFESGWLADGVALCVTAAGWDRLERQMGRTRRARRRTSARKRHPTSGRCQRS